MRTTEAKVRSIVTVGASVSTLAPFLGAATAFFDAVITDTTNLTSTMQELVERYLAAHFYSVSHRRRIAETAGPVSATYENGKLGLGLKATLFGQQAMLLDTTGQLSQAQTQLESGVSPVVDIFATASLTWGTLQERPEVV